MAPSRCPRRHRIEQERIRRLAATVALLVASGLALAAPGSAGVRVAITSTGFFPADVTVEAGTSIEFTNSGIVPASVTSTEAPMLFESGDLAPGAGFTMALSVPGDHVYRSSANLLLQGKIRVVTRTLGGADADRAIDWIPAIRFPADDPADFGVDPAFGVEASVSRIMLGFKPDATVAQANAALADGNVRIIGGLPDIGMLLVEVYPRYSYPGPFAELATALAALRSHADAVDYAAMVTAVEPLSVPRGADDDAAGSTPGWDWANQAKGKGNWGLVSAKFPQAWNFLEGIRQTQPETVTGIVDAGFAKHDDLPTLTIAPSLCPRGGGNCVSIGNNPSDHSDHVAGIIGAAYDNPATAEPPRSARSKGVAGGNPFATMTGYSLSSFSGRPAADVAGISGIDKTLELFDLILQSAPPTLRVINYSAGAASFSHSDKLREPLLGEPYWWKHFGRGANCGPGALDDDLPSLAADPKQDAAKQVCTPNNADEWLREWGHIGHAASEIAKRAAQQGVMVVQAAGNESQLFCPGGPGTCIPIDAASRGEFSWASRHWNDVLIAGGGALGLPNPVFVVQSLEEDGAARPDSAFGGDIAAPGDGILSTVRGNSYKSKGGTSMAAPYVTALIGYLLAEHPDLTIDQVRRLVLGWASARPGQGAADFTWTMPDRMNRDTNEDRLVDYPLPADVARARRVDFDACGASANGATVSVYTWSVDGQVVGSSGSCTFEHSFDHNGTYQVTLNLLGSAGATATVTKQVDVRDVLIVSIGDSIASGEGNPDVTDPTITWEEERCHRSAVAGPAQAARAIEMADTKTSVTFVHLACSGARVRGDRDASGAVVAGALGVGGLLTPYEGITQDETSPCALSLRTDLLACLPPQLDRAKEVVGSRTPDALLVSIGANDMFFSTILLDCMFGPADCTKSDDGLGVFNARWPLLSRRYDELAAKIHETFRNLPDDHVFIPQYPDVTTDENGIVDLGCGFASGISQTEAQWAKDSVIPALNQAVSDAAVKHGWTLVAGIPQAFYKHGYCSSDSWIVGTVGSFYNQHGRDGAFHPNLKGHRAYGDLIAKAVGQKLGLTLTPSTLLTDRAPRLNAFLAAAANGPAARMVDVNDPSKDGNRRSELVANEDRTVTEKPDEQMSKIPGDHAAPDGRVDMRDLRRFRDAWLGQCVENALACPSPGDVDLNGKEDNPKRDQNLDGCVWRAGDPGGCGVGEMSYSRFDFNGDGVVAPLQKSFVPWKVDGSPAAQRGEGTMESDVDVLKSAWTGGPGAEGWVPADLERLLKSADLEVHADEIFALGASAAQVQVREKGGGADVGPSRTIRRRDGFIVVTVPISSTSQEYELATRATTSKGALSSVSEPFALKYGQDKYLAVCPDLTIAASPPQLPADGTSTSIVTATLHKCKGRTDVADKPITFTLTNGGSGSTLQALALKTDTEGKAQGVLTAGVHQGTSHVEASVDVDLGSGNDPLKATVDVDVVPMITVKYVWRQTIEDWWEQGSTRWTDASPLLPDCAIAGSEYCIDTFRLQFDRQAGSGTVRTGTLSGGGNRFAVSERVTDSAASSKATWTLSKPDGSTETGAQDTTWYVTDPAAYQDHAIDGLQASDQTDGIHLDGIQAVGDLPHHYALYGGLTGGKTDPIEIHAAKEKLLLIPQGADTHIRFAAHPDKEVLFIRDASGGFKPFSSCGVVEDDLTTAPGYYVSDPSPYIAGALSVTRKRDYIGGDRPMPVGPGHLRVRYSFAAVASYQGEPSPEPTLPDCTTPNAPKADFKVTPADGGQAREGRQVRLDDLSTDPDNDIVKWEWSFGDGKADVGPIAHHMFPDGPKTYTVKLTVTDAKGNTDATTKDVDVANEPPEASIYDANAQVDTLKVTYRTLDPGSDDKTQLRWTITSPNPAFPPQGGTDHAGVHWTSFKGLPLGTYPLVLTVTDKDGATARDQAVAIITDAPPVIPPPPPAVAFVSCGAAVGSEEAAFVDLVNEYRAENGLKPVAASTALMAAAVRHAHDMATKDFMAHTGSDGSNAEQRAYAAGYPKTGAVAENLAEGEAAADVLWAWRGSSTGHNENMLNPAWKVIGVAREQASIWRWATSYGSVSDCPGGSSPDLVPSGTTTPPAPSSGTGSGTGTGAAQVLADPGNGTPEPTTTATAPSALTGTSTQLGATTQPAGAGATASPQFAPGAAFAISNVEPTERKPVTFTNRSRDASGVPIGATVDFADGSPAAALGPDESVVHRFPRSDYLDVTLTAVDGAGRATTVDRWVFVEALPRPGLHYSGPTQGISGTQLAVAADLYDAGTSAPIVGATLTFTLAGATATATTDASGTARATIDLVQPAGYYALIVSFGGNDDLSGTQRYTTISVITNASPVADPGGPYILGSGGTLLLDGGRSSDPDPGDQIASWAWDLNGDGAADLTGATPRAVLWADLQALLCTTACVPNYDYPVALTVTDTHGEPASATTTVRFVSDFGLFLGGGTKTIVPGQSNSFAVTVVGSTDFHDPVTLDAVGLPDGVTAFFSVNPVTAPGVSVLTLAAGPAVQTGTFPIHVTGTASGVTHDVSDEVLVAFGLVPVCYTTAQVTAVDDLGQPLAGVFVYDYYSGSSGMTDANGRLILRQLPLGFNNAPSAVYVTAQKNNYWATSAYEPTACGATTQLGLTLIGKQNGHVSGVVNEGIADSNGENVVPRGTPAPAASVTFSDYYNGARTFTADTNGAYAGDVLLGQDNGPTLYSATAGASGYWYQRKNVVVRRGEPQQLDFELVKQCTGTIDGGGLIYEDGSPARNHQIGLWENGRYPTVFATTDANGAFTFNASELLGYNNTPTSYKLTAYHNADDPPGTQDGSGSMPLAACGSHTNKTFVLRRPVVSYGTLDGIVRDEETNQPVAHAYVDGFGAPGVFSDASGRFHVEQIFIGYDQTSASHYVSASEVDFYRGGAVVTLQANQVTTAEIKLLHRRYGAANGTVRDSVTGAPVPFTGVGNFSYYGCSVICAVSDRDGRYSRQQVGLGDRNAPIAGVVKAQAEGYWSESKYVLIEAGKTTTTDFDLLRKCAPAKIVGTVVNAETQQPIQGALILGNGTGAYTNPAGRFQIDNIDPGFGNNPLQVYLTASAYGFFSQSKVVTIFCGATIVADFGTRQSSLGIVAGTIRDTDTGQPMANLFVGTEFGGTATTDADGNYRLENVPLGDQNTDKAWTVTVAPAGYTQQIQTVVARANVEVRADFAFSKLSNHPPVAQAQNVSANENDSNIPVTLAAVDVDADPLTYAVAIFPRHGSLGGVAPALSYTPDSNYYGPDSFVFTANDGQDTSAPATVAIDVAHVNQPPVAKLDTFTATVGTPVTLDVLANDSDVDGDALSITDLFFNAFVNGTVTIVGNKVLYTPIAHFEGIYQFSYRITDGHGAFASSSVDVNVVAGPPTCSDASFSGAIDRPLTGTLACTGGSSETLAYALVTGAAHGTVALAPNGRFTYTPEPGLGGTESFTFTASDGTQVSNVATATLIVAAAIVVDGTPVPSPDEFSTHQGAPLDIPYASLTANDSDPEGEPLFVVTSSVTGAAHGTIAVGATGLTYTPDRGFSGDDTFSYRISDGRAQSAPAMVTVHVTDAAPVAAADEYSVHAGQVLHVVVPGPLANDSDPDGDRVAVVSGTQPAHGTYLLSAEGDLTYTPAAGFSGTDSLTYVVTDGALTSSPATITFHVTNRPPVGVPESYSVHFGQSLHVPAPGVLGNDTDPESDPLTASLMPQRPQHGQAALATTGELTYTPNAGFVGDDSFTYTPNDGFADGAPVIVTIHVTNAAPSALDDHFTAIQGHELQILDPGVLANDSDPDSDPIQSVSVTQPAHGQVFLAPAGGFRYQPDPGFHGVDSFSYRASDGGSSSAPVAVSIFVDGTPTAVGDNFATHLNTPLTLDALTANDTDPEKEPLTVVTSSVTQPAHGVVTQTATGWLYTPEHGYVGRDAFQYAVTDGFSLSAPATVQLDVTDTPPVATADGYSVHAGQPLHVAAPGPLANDSDPDGDAFSVLSAGPQPAHGHYLLTASGELTYTPDPRYVGDDSFTYRISDGGLTSVPATITVHVTNQPPVGTADTYDMHAGSTLHIAAPGVLGNDSDPEADPLTASSMPVPPSHGTAKIATTGELVYTPDPAFVGTDTFTYTPNDGFADGAPTTVTVHVTDTPPDVAPDSFSIHANTTLNVDEPGVARNDSDPENDPFRVHVATSPSHGHVTLTEAGGLRYLPDHNYVGPDSFTYTAEDGFLTSAPASVTIEVTDAPPVAGADAATTAEDSAVTGNVLGNDSDPDGDAIAVALFAAPQHGTATLAPDGTFSYVPEPNFNGTDSFTYLLSDGILSVQGTVTVTVTEVNDVPVARSDTLTTAEDVQGTADVLANDLAGPPNESGQHLVLDYVGTPAHGTAAIVAGRLVYSPDPNYNGPDSVTYVACDDGTTGGAPDPRCATAAVAIDVTPVNDAPRASDAAVALNEDDPPLRIDLHSLARDLETTSANLSFSIVANPTKGTLTGSGGVYSYDSNDNANGRDSFTYRVTDRGDPDGCTPPGARCDAPASATGTISFAIAPVNDPPVVQLAAAGPVDEGAAPITLVARATDVDITQGEEQTLTYSWSSDIGTVTPVGDGSRASFAADDGPANARVTVKVCDNGTTNGAPDPKCATDTQTVVVRNVPPAVTASSLPTTQYWGLPVHFVGAATDPSRADTGRGFRYEWNFGDLVVSPDNAVDHAYALPGAYTAVFSATDKDGGRGSKPVTVTITRRPTAISFTAPLTQPFGPTQLSAQLADTTDPPTAQLVGRVVTFQVGGRTFTATTDAAGRATVTPAPFLLSGPVAVSVPADSRYHAATATAQLMITNAFGNGPGFFILGDRTSTAGTVTWWGAQWEKLNVLSGGASPSAFKGFVNTLSVPGCIGSWTTDPGNSSRPPDSVGPYVAVIVASRITKSGSTISGNTVHIVAVKTAPGYGPNPGHDGTGQVVGTVC